MPASLTKSSLTAKHETTRCPLEPSLNAVARHAQCTLLSEDMRTTLDSRAVRPNIYRRWQRKQSPSPSHSLVAIAGYLMPTFVSVSRTETTQVQSGVLRRTDALRTYLLALQYLFSFQIAKCTLRDAAATQMNTYTLQLRQRSFLVCNLYWRSSHNKWLIPGNPGPRLGCLNRRAPMGGIMVLHCVSRTVCQVLVPSDGSVTVGYEFYLSVEPAETTLSGEDCTSILSRESYRIRNKYKQKRHSHESWCPPRHSVGHTHEKRESSQTQGCIVLIQYG